MTRALVTGCAGFIGSHLCERLLNQGVEVLGVDCFSDYYPRPLKEANLSIFRKRSGFAFRETDLVEADFPALLDGVTWVFHLAGDRVRASWGLQFERYVHHNILATQRLLEACCHASVNRFVLASSSSIYGDADRYPTTEDVTARPLSPYGVTKLSCEQLCWTYLRNEKLPVVALRYFSVYGPRQRPDMAFNIFLRHLLMGRPLPVFGDGQQTRDFTYVDDIVAATIRAAEAEGALGQAFNIGGGSRVSLGETVRILGQLAGVEPVLEHEPRQRGDARDTGASLDKARRILAYDPQVNLETGLLRQYEWTKANLEFLEANLPP